MKIAICGIRGIPACYGGFETFAEEISRRLVDRGHEVVVYGRTHVIKYDGSHYNGVRVKLLKAPQHKYFETPVHTLSCLLDILRNPVDVTLVCNAANSPFLFLHRLFRRPIVVNVDGIERKRAKWNMVGKLWYRFGEITSVLFANKLISDAEVIQTYYRKTYRCDSELIRYGCNHTEVTRARAKVLGEKISFSKEELAIFSELGVSPGGYLLYVSRLEPENNAHLAVQAYNALPEERKTRPLLVVGDAPYSKEYVEYVKSIAGENVIFAGFQFGERYRVLQLGAHLYLQATEVGGTHPALVEAMGFGNCVLANSTPEHVEVLGAAGDYYRKNDVFDLVLRLSELLKDESTIRDLRRKAFERALSEFDWEKITTEYERLFHNLVSDTEYLPPVIEDIEEEREQRQLANR